MQCDKCGFDSPAGMRFCGHCAAPLRRPCPRCGFLNPADFAFCGHCAGSLDTAAAVTDTTAPRRPQATSASAPAERRQLTVLFCDMVGSSALSERLDPEELRDIMRDYRATCSEVVARYEGHVAQFLGDGILVYFGYPRAHEDDARRAVQAALEISRHIPQLCYTTSHDEQLCLAVRVGVHTGLVVVGEIGDGDKRSLALGDTPNISARLQNLAEPNAVVISSATYRLVENHFDCASLGEQRLKGFSQPLQIYRVRDEHGIQSLFTPHGTRTHPTPLIGREQESRLLQERLAQARQGGREIVLLSGEAGLGKTRMVQMVYESLGHEPCTLLECAGSPYYQNSFLFPVIDLAQRLLGLNELNNPADKSARLHRAVADLGLDSAQVVPLLAELLSLPRPAEHAAAATTPQQQKRQTFTALLDMLRLMTRQRLVVLVVEDLHWLDPSTLELLGQLLAQTDINNLFALFTFRNEYTPPWPASGDLSRISLNKLTRSQVGSMIHQLCRGKTLPLELFNAIVAKTDGVPYFVEELTNMVLDSQLLRERADHFELISPMAELAIPSTLQDSLMSRLDRLGEDKELAQLCATLGREFAHELLHALSPRDEPSLRQGLENLIDAELFFQSAQPPQARYGFRHALLREAAYQSLLKRTRQQYHQRIAALLKSRFPATLASHPELMAYHCSEAGEHAEAVRYWLAAGRHAMRHSANVEAAAHLRQGLNALAQLPANAATRAQELALQTLLGLAVMMNKGYAALEVEQAYERARELCGSLDDVPAVYPVLSGQWEFYIVRAELETAAELAQQLHALSQQTQEPALKLEARRVQGTTLFWQGQLQEAFALLAASEEDAEPQTEAVHTVSYCQDARVAALANAGCIAFLLGNPDLALARAREALQLATRLAHPFSQAYATHFLGVVHQLRGETEAVRRHAETQLELGDTYGFAFWSATGRMLQAWAQGREDPGHAPVAAFEEALAAYEACGSRLACSYFLALLAELHHMAGRLDEARETVHIALRETTASGERFFVAELLRLKGTLSEDSEALLGEALEQARHQSAHALALRTATDLASLWSRQGKAGPAAALLEQHLALINGGQDTGDVVAARRLLASLRDAARATSSPA
jgi:predicted ATPase/class 3 adenylate cyclase